MIQTSRAPEYIVILKDVLLSALAGILFGCVLFPWFTAILQATQNDNYALFNFGHLLMSTLTAPLLIIIIAPLLIPLIAIACLIAVIFHKSIYKYIKIWCICSPILVWLTVIAILVKSPPNQYYSGYSEFDRFLMQVPKPDHFLFLIAPAFSSFVFYKLSQKRQQ